jgi:Ferredoxin
MISPQELNAIRQRTKDELDVSSGKTRVVVGLATCGIAAGARPILTALNEGIEREGVQNVVVSQTGCIGLCQFEPIVEVYTPDGARATYVGVTPEKAERILSEHIVGGKPVDEYLLNLE